MILIPKVAGLAQNELAGALRVAQIDVVVNTTAVPVSE